MDSDQEVSTQTDMDDSDSAPTSCSGLSSTTSNNGQKAPQNAPANYGIIRFIFIMWLILWVGSATFVLPALAHKSLTCKAGFRLEKHEHEEKCVPCGPTTFMPENDHRNEACNYCREKEPTGSLTQIIWPCTWTSDAQIGCLREKGKEAFRHNGEDSGKCKPCGPRCKEGEIEIQPCTEYTNRTCQIISGDGSDSKSIPSEIDSGDTSEETDGKTVETTTLPPLDSIPTTNVDSISHPSASDSQQPSQNNSHSNSITSEIDSGNKSEETDGKTVESTTLPPPASISTTDHAANTPPPSVSDVTFERGCKEDSQKPPQNRKDDGTNNECPSLTDVYVLLLLVLIAAVVVTHFAVFCYDRRKQGDTVNIQGSQIQLKFQEYAVPKETGFNDRPVFSERNKEEYPLMGMDFKSRETGIYIDSSANTPLGTPANRRRPNA